MLDFPINTATLNRCAEALERLGDLFEHYLRATGTLQDPHTPSRSSLDDLSAPTDLDLWQIQQEELRKQRLGEPTASDEQPLRS